MTSNLQEGDAPNQYCCEAMEFAVGIGSITYHADLEEFRLIRVCALLRGAMPPNSNATG